MQEPLSGDAPRTDEAAVQRLRGWLHLLVLLLITFCLVIGERRRGPRVCARS
jgi:hypothetical protein